MSSNGTLLMEVSNGGTTARTTAAALVGEGAVAVGPGCRPGSVGAGLLGDGVAVAEVPQAAAISSNTGIQRNNNLRPLPVLKLLIRGFNNRFSELTIIGVLDKSLMP